MDAKKKKLLETTYGKFLESTVKNGPLEDLAQWVDDMVMGYGTTLDEKMASFDEYKEMTVRQKEQAAGMEMGVVAKPVLRKTLKDENATLLVDELEITFFIGEDKHELFIRLSTVLEYSHSQWKVVHFHASKPDSTDGEKDTWYISEWERKNAELERLVAEKTAVLVQKNRELEIEAALERVRSRTMAMHKSEELINVATVMYDAIKNLGITQSAHCGFTLINEENKRQELWGSQTDSNLLVHFTLPLTGDQVFLERYEAWKRKEPFFSQKLDAQQLKQHMEVAMPDAEITEEERRSKLDMPETTYFHFGNFSHGYLQIIATEPLDKEQTSILVRFAKVFEQTYTRFLDLQKAEAQAREAQIEVALERVRSRTMAMHKSEELGETIFILFNQLKELNIPLQLSWVSLMDDKENKMENWMTRGEGIAIPNIIHASDFAVFDRNIEAWKQGQDAFVPVPKEKAREIVRKFFHLDLDLPDHATFFHVMNFWHRFGFIGVGTFEDLGEEERQILKRFAKVFEQTYTRFLDLQKAEAQAREAQIEAALERVRSRALAMRRSDELSEAAELLYHEFLKMGVESFSCGYLINDDEKDEWKIWLTNPGEPFFKEFWTAPYDADHNLEARYESWKSKEEFHCAVLEGEENRAHHVVISKFAPWKEAMLDSLPPRLVFNSAHFSLGHLLVISPDRLAPELEQAMVRFAKVFDLTWRRFLDLQKAEARAREERIEAGLDRVRAEIASMRSTEDLERITPLVWRELTTLEVPFFRCGVFIMDEEKELVHTYLSTPDGKSLSVLHLPFDSTETTRKTVEHWRKQEVYLDNWDKQQFTGWVQSLTEQGYLKESKAYQGAEQPPEALALHFVPFKQGMLYVGNSEKLSKEQVDLVQRLADTFAVAYARYEDFTKLEEAKRKVETTLTDLKITQAKLIHSEKLAMLGELAAVEEKRKLEITLSELKATQAQLIQSEKLASLGELTAGIAHEIQNPLNFVNNFSELSVDLAEELKLEIGKLEIPEKDREYVGEILGDLSQNQEKINHHGKRAAAIVTGMLQHARTSTGKKEPTDLNALADEYLRLSYHGLRAKDADFNAQMVTDFDPAVGLVEVIPQDIGRVFLNIINNAFYATQQRQKEIGKLEIGKLGVPFEPIVSIASKRTDNGVEFRIKDNGTGIPDEVKAKIFQPFFTTKPTGQGTGLGLSLAYDIVVKGHGGTLEVDSKEGEGTEFIVHLPAFNNQNEPV